MFGPNAVSPKEYFTRDGGTFQRASIEMIPSSGELLLVIREPETDPQILSTLRILHSTPGAKRRKGNEDR